MRNLNYLFSALCLAKHIKSTKKDAIAEFVPVSTYLRRTTLPTIYIRMQHLTLINITCGHRAETEWVLGLLAGNLSLMTEKYTIPGQYYMNSEDKSNG